jgi:transposase
VIAPLLPNKPRGVPRVDDRRVLNGIFWVLRIGAPWRALPKEFGPRTTCYNRFVRWRKASVWDAFWRRSQRLTDRICRRQHAAAGSWSGDAARGDHLRASLGYRGGAGVQPLPRRWPCRHAPAMLAIESIRSFGLTLSVTRSCAIIPEEPAVAGIGLVTATIDEPRRGKGKSGFMVRRRHLATAPSLRLERPAAWTER